MAATALSAGVQILAPIALTAAFGPAGTAVGGLIAAAFDQPAFVDITSESHFTYTLAPSYGKLNDATIKAMDDNLKVGRRSSRSC